MRIIDNTKISAEFRAIKIGDCFIYDNCLFIKINPVNEIGYDKAANAFCFMDNSIMNIPNDRHVTPVEAEVVIRSNGVE